jgi:hypothetical protein
LQDDDLQAWLATSGLGLQDGGVDRVTLHGGDHGRIAVATAIT